MRERQWEKGNKRKAMREREWESDRESKFKKVSLMCEYEESFLSQVSGGEIKSESLSKSNLARPRLRTRESFPFPKHPCRRPSTRRGPTFGMCGKVFPFEKASGGKWEWGELWSGEIFANRGRGENEDEKNDGEPSKVQKLWQGRFLSHRNVFSLSWKASLETRWRQNGRFLFGESWRTKWDVLDGSGLGSGTWTEPRNGEGSISL